MGNSFPPRGLSFPPIKWEHWISSLPALLLANPVLRHGSSRTVMVALCCLYVTSFPGLAFLSCSCPNRKAQNSGTIPVSRVMEKRSLGKIALKGRVRNQGLKKTVLNPTEWQEMAKPSPKTGSPDPQLSALPRPPLLLWGKSSQGWDEPPSACPVLCLSLPGPHMHS